MNDINQENLRIIRPQPGPQTMLLACDADIAFFGGAAGGGKTYGILLDFLNHYDERTASGIFFRRTTPEITELGGPWETSKDLYHDFGGVPKESSHLWTFSSGAKLRFTHLEKESDRYKFQGSQLAIQYWDELSHFTKKQFFYLLSRNRSTGNIRPYIRATTNPLPDSWIYEMIEWYIDPITGIAIPERSGVIRYFYNENDKLYWDNDKEALMERFPQLAEITPPKSFTFIPSHIHDNKILMEEDPAYMANLMSLSQVDRERLLFGNWKVREDAGTYFKRDYFPIIEPKELPSNLLKIRFWDRAGTSAKEVAELKRDNLTQARTASLLLGYDVDSMLFYIEDVTNELLAPKEVVNRMTDVVGNDGLYVTIGLSQDPGQAGKFEVEFYQERFGHYHVWIMRETGSKESRAKPVSAQAQKKRIILVRGAWNEQFLNQAENFPDGLKDIIDALTGGFSYFVEQKLAALDVYQSGGYISNDNNINMGDNNSENTITEVGAFHNNW